MGNYEYWPNGSGMSGAKQKQEQANWWKRENRINWKKTEQKQQKQTATIIKCPNTEILCSNGLAQQDLKHNWAYFFLKILGNQQQG